MIRTKDLWTWPHFQPLIHTHPSLPRLHFLAQMLWLWVVRCRDTRRPTTSLSGPWSCKRLWIPIVKLYCHQTPSAWVTIHRRCLFLNAHDPSAADSLYNRLQLHSVTSAQVYSCCLAAKSVSQALCLADCIAQISNTLLAAHIKTSWMLDCIEEGQKTQGLVQLKCLFAELQNVRDKQSGEANSALTVYCGRWPAFLFW